MAQANPGQNTQAIANSIYNLMRRLPPNQVSKSLAGIGSLLQDDELKQRFFDQVDQPLGKYHYTSGADSSKCAIRVGD